MKNQYHKHLIYKVVVKGGKIIALNTYIKMKSKNIITYPAIMDAKLPNTSW